MIQDTAKNPGLLKLDLYCKGIRLDDSCFVEEDGGRPILRTRAGLGSGLEAVLPGELWTNIPVAEDFAKESPYLLKRVDQDYVIYRGSDAVAPIRLAGRPAWYDKLTSSGKPMRSVGTLQGTYLGVYPAKVCEYWVVGHDRAERDNCKFCSVGLNLGADDADEKSVQDVVETAIAAWKESGITYVDFNTGHYTGHTFLDILEPYIRRVKEETGVLIGVQTPPHPDLSRYEHLKEIGVNRVSFCFEIFDPDRFIEVCPGKHEAYGLKTYLNAVEHCAKLSDFRRPTTSPWVSNGEIIAGLEDPQASIDAIDWLTEHNAIPTVCVFRPLKGTDYEHLSPPKTEDMIPVFRRLYDRCMERNLPIGLAPNIHVSLVMLPEECRYLADDPGRFRVKEWKLSMKKKAFRMLFDREQRKYRTRAARRSSHVTP